MNRRIRSILGRTGVVAVVAVAAYLAVTAPAGSQSPRRPAELPPSLDSVPRHPWPDDTSWRDTLRRDTLRRDTLADSSRHRRPRKPHRPLR